MNVEGKQFEYFKTFLLLAVIFVILVLLNKFGLFKFGDSKEEKESKKLFTLPQFEKAYEKVLMAALQKKYNKKKFSQNEINAMLPKSSEMYDFYKNLEKAKGLFDDNEAAIYGVFKSFKNQLQLWFFAQFFLKTKGEDLIGYLGEFMNDNELAKLYNIINTKPLL